MSFMGRRSVRCRFRRDITAARLRIERAP